MVCPRCETENEPGRKFCAECGAPLAVVCAACGTANAPGAKFCGECGSPLTAPAAAVPAEPVVERRLVAVLFADLVGFTTLAEGRDAEDVRDLLSRYFELARTIVERYGGEVEKFIGDAVMAVWGTPAAREDDAERAVRAALELVPAVAALGAEAGAPGLGARAAVVTGEAAVTLGAEGHGMVAGDLVNSASRVQGLADGGTVLVGDGARRATEASIAFEDAGVHELRGRSEPVQLWRAVRVTAGLGGGLKPDAPEPPFVGRDGELRLLKELYNATAEQRRAHFVSIVGIAGIGKSRLVQELQRYLDGLTQSAYWHSGRCLAYGEGVSDWAFAEMIRMRAGISEGEEAESARAKLRAALEAHVPDAAERQWIEPRLAQLLALDGSEVAERSDLVAGWRLFLERIAEAGPVVLVFEDVQWADAPLLEFVEYLLEWSSAHPLFVVALTRPELEERSPRWAGAIRNTTTLALEPLSPEAMGSLLDGFVPGLPADLREAVLARAEGVPLYAVETVRSLLDRGLLERQGGEYRPAQPIERLEVPETLHALIAARLDGLELDERRLVQDAAVIGKSFGRDALAAVTAVPAESTEGALRALVRKEVVVLQADPRSPERGQFTFLQDLLRHVAYETLSRGERRARHLAVAAHLAQDALDGQHELAEILASHYVTALELDPEAPDAAEVRAKARATLVRAGERAAALAASENAQRYFEQALALAESALDRAVMHERAGLMAARGNRTQEARAHLGRAAAAYEEAGDEHAATRVAVRLAVDVTWLQEGDIARAAAELEQSFAALAGHERDADFAWLAVQYARLLHFSGRSDEAMEPNEVALEIAEAQGLPEILSHGLNTKGLILSAGGRLTEGELLLRHALELALAHDFSDATLRAYQNLTAVVAGRDAAREALELARAGVGLARRIGHRGSEQALLNWANGLRLQLGEWDSVLAEEPPQEEATRASGYLLLLAVPALLARDERAEAEARVRTAATLVDANEPQSLTGLRAAEALVLLDRGKAAEALAAAEEALALVAGTVYFEGALEAALEAAFALADGAKIDELLGIVEELPPGQITPTRRALAARFGARRAAATGNGATAEAAFAAAARIYREIESPFELAVVRLEHAEWLAAEGRADETEPLLAEAREIFERLAATPWLERTDAAGSRVPAREAVS